MEERLTGEDEGKQQEAVYLADRVIVLKNAAVDCDVKIELDRPRDMKSPDFAKYIEYFEKRLGDIPLTSD